MSDCKEIEYAFSLPEAPENLPEEYTLIQQIYINVETTKILVFPSLPEADVAKGMLMIVPEKQGDAVLLTIDDSVFRKIKSISKPVASNPAIRIIKDSKENLCVRLRSNTPVTPSGVGMARYEFTIKAAHKDSLPSLPVRIEVNVPLEDREGERLAMALDEKIDTGRNIVKKRYILPVREDSSLSWEMDVFLEPVTLVKAEVEVPSKETPCPSPPEKWNAVDVTGCALFDNAELSLGAKQ
jgi:hypothetical protein